MNKKIKQNKCKMTTSKKHYFMSETMTNHQDGWQLKFKKCVFCGLVDDKTINKIDLGVSWKKE